MAKARITFKGVEEYQARLVNLGKRAHGCCKYALYEGAGKIADAIKAATPVDSGDLRESLTVDDMTTTENEVYTLVHFSGYDSKGVPNAIKARVIDHGNSHVPAKPFIRQAANRVRSASVAAMGEAMDRKINEIMNE